MKLEKTPGYQVISDWLAGKGMKPFEFQQETWRAICAQQSGLVNAPTGFGKTFSVYLGALINFINQNPATYKTKRKNGLQLLWVTPLRALAKDIGRAMEEVIAELGMSWQIGSRNGDTDLNERAKQKRNMPEVLIITPESLHLLLATKDYPTTFQNLQTIAVDEWHELLGSKRGVQVELAISRIAGVKNSAITKALAETAVSANAIGATAKVKRAATKTGDVHQHELQQLSVWGISATIGNLDEARDVLLSPLQQLAGVDTTDTTRFPIIVARLQKKIAIESVIPDEIEKYPWAGHLGLNLAEQAIEIIRANTTTLMFINTRGMSERWYQKILELAPDLAGAIALHHGSIERELRTWVEEALHTTKLKAVVCTASLDLGVDFRPVETVIQVGSPKGVARFLQRAGRSGHQPGKVSKIYFLPTHTLELVEAAALKQAMHENLIETREPRILCFDVLIQYLCTLAIGEGFLPDQVYEEVKSTWCFSDITDDEWQQMLHSIVSGGEALQQYDEYKKVEIGDDGIYRIRNRRIAMRHRLHIGTIVGDSMVKVKFMAGGYIGVIEESFISRMAPGDVFTLSGRVLEFVMIKDMTALVRKSNATKSNIPSWNGGRMPLSSNLGKMLRKKFNEAHHNATDVELLALKPLFDLQQELSHVPQENELLIEQIETKDGFHLFVYPFEGRLVHEAMAAILAYRISQITPITFSFAMNDYGFELLSDQPIPVDDTNVYELFSTDNLFADIQRSVNATEMAMRKFRDIAVIGGLIFQGFPGEQKKTRHLQSSAGLLFKVFSEYDARNLLLRQAYNEVMDQQMEEVRLRSMLERIQQSAIILTYPDRLTPFCFPIKVDSMREDMSSEKLEDRVRKMQARLTS
ncbi:ligase-associated DNA damage response DEXH box helicase [Segetibacter sp. 3557_3]|uniref:ligase-associated DNA damage response DEXH box helicase n=1 Tax=Segetibacter sp. 3557_3 TaxID=2547429 RepID=UPI001058DD5C|nr:ligase-associated DNA damage response DEXH box helicase [Segetibacter sp. 3557_3]TDH27390.1 ligase-associated DNA damage response DEXH box helicase [Segetibacter sp. 3557_3]